MHLWWFISIFVYLFRPFYALLKTEPEAFPWLEKYHYPGAFTEPPTQYINGTDTKISDIADTPDYRIEEPDFTIHNERDPLELERPYRNSPVQKQATKSKFEAVKVPYWSVIEQQMGCYCCTVYKRLTVLTTCAVITSRHILTTATPTALILRSYSHLKTLENILGGWYDISGDIFNSSMYMTPARIHFHPMYANEYEVNVSHPIPAMYDLSIWASTYTFHKSVIICPRAASSWQLYTHTIPGESDLSIVAGFMFMKSYHRRPMPWFRYIVKTAHHLWPCPKSDWQWFHCISGEYWGRYGFDSGGGMNTAYRNKGWRFDGFAGMCAFSMKLRSKQTTHYFTVIDTHPVLDFMYDAFLGLKKCVYLDDRFEDTRWSAPLPYWGEHISYTYELGHEAYFEAGNVPKYRR